MSTRRKSTKGKKEKEIEDENSPSFLRWQLKTLLSENLKTRQQFVDQSVKQEELKQCLEKDLEALKEELQSVEEERRTLKDHLQQSLANEESARKTNGNLRNELEQTKNDNEKLTAEFAQYRARSEEKEEELKEQLENMKAETERERDRLSRAVDEQQKEIRRVWKVADNLKTQYNLLMDNHKTALAKFKVVLEMNEVTNGVLNSKLRTIEADLKEKELEKIESFKRRLNLKDEKIRKLEELKELEGVVKHLTSTVEDNRRLLEYKDLQMERMKESMSDIIAKDNKRKLMENILQSQLTEAEKQIRALEEEQTQRERSIAALQEEKLERREENQKLHNTLAQCSNRLQLSEKSNKNLDRKVRELERYQAQFRADLNTCVAVMGNPKEVKVKLGALKRRYINDERDIKLAQDTEEEYRNRIGELQHKLQCQEKMCHNQEKTMRKMQLRMESLDTVAAAREIHYIQLLNTEIATTQDLRKKLRDEGQRAE